MADSALYESFNARNLSPEDIAKTFVVPDEFGELCANNSVVIMGPRGSGKTTMLKMLTERALTSWSGKSAKIFKESVSFMAIYIPADIHWHHQLLHSAERFGSEPSPSLDRHFSEMAVTTNILAAVVSALADHLKLAGVEGSEEADLSRALSKAWRLSLPVPVLPAVQEALATRLNDAYVDIEKLRAAGAGIGAGLPDYFYIDYLAAVLAARQIFDRIFPASAQRKWALCFDELEIAPAWLQDRLFVELRSISDRLLLKLSTSPLPDLSGVHQSSNMQDFKVIRLWPHVGGGARAFCEKLVDSILERSYSVPVSAESLFGISPSHDKKSQDYSRESPSYEMFKELARIDPGFKRVLVLNGLSPEDPYTDLIEKRDQILRKAKPIAMHRLAFVKAGRAGASRRRSRKVYGIYFGREAIFEVSEGNPRWLYVIVTNLLQYARPGKRGGPPQQIPAQVQERVLRDVSRQFGNFIRTGPGGASGRNGLLTLIELVSLLGLQVFDGLVINDFTLDPVGSFWVDPEVPESLYSVLRMGAYLGAIIMVDPSGTGPDWEIKGMRFRITNLLAPEMRLPLRQFKAMPLSGYLDGRKRRPRNRTKGPQFVRQGTLPY